MTKSFLKWAGNKYRVLPHIKQHLPHGNRYFEPFLGAGALALNVPYRKHYLSDVNSDLINVWVHLQKGGCSFVDQCQRVFKDSNNNGDVYGKFRDEFNTSEDPHRKAILFVYLNRHCFNGLCRYNRRGEFNVSFGAYKKPYFPRAEMLECHRIIGGFDIGCRDFRESFEMVKRGDVVYCDPPYVPLSDTSNFTSYATGGFSLQDHRDLVECAEKASSKGATVLISNNENAFELYMDAYDIRFFEVSRTISCDATKRQPTTELLAIYREDPRQTLNANKPRPRTEGAMETNR